MKNDPELAVKEHTQAEVYLIGKAVVWVFNDKEGGISWSKS